MLGDAVCLLLLAARCLLPLQRLVCEIAEEVKPEMKFQSQAMSGTVEKRERREKREERREKREERRESREKREERREQRKKREERRER